MQVKKTSGKKKKRRAHEPGRRNAILILALFTGIAAAFIFADRREAAQELSHGIARGSTEDEILEETYIAETEDGEKIEVPVTVYPRSLDEEEKEAYLEQALEEFEAEYLGANASADEVSEALVLSSSYADGMVTAVFESDEPQILWEDGSISPENVSGEGQLVTLSGIFTCQGASLTYSCSLWILPESSADRTSSGELAEEVSDAESASRTEEYFQLPDTFGGEVITWTKKISPEPFLLILIGAAAGVCILQRPVQRRKQEKKQREKELMQGYPLLVMQMSLLMGAGMTAVTAWERMVKRYLRRQEERPDAKKELYMEEMLITWREIRDGCGTKRAWEKFGSRIGLAPYRKFSSLLIQNMDKGTRDIAALLNQEAELVLEEQKNSARRLGEEAGTKLLMPMMMLLLLVLLLVMIPAMMSL